MAGAADAIDPKRDRLVITASSLGTIFEWYDFFVYGILATLIGKLFFPSDNPTAATLLSLAVFGAGFGVRPLGAILFGYLGDKIGRKYTFLVTISLMGVATAAIGFLPTFATAGIAAAGLLLLMRCLQGLALGGEYGGAAIYVAKMLQLSFEYDPAPPFDAGNPDKAGDVLVQAYRDRVAKIAPNREADFDRATAALGYPA